MQEKLSEALSVAVSALCTMQSVKYEDYRDRSKLFIDALANIRSIVGDDHRLTSMPRKCIYCKEPLGTKEGNGATGETSAICPPCMESAMAGVTA